MFGLQRPYVYRDHAPRPFSGSEFEIMVDCPLYFFGAICIDPGEVEWSGILDAGKVVLPTGVFVEIENTRSVPCERLREKVFVPCPFGFSLRQSIVVNPDNGRKSFSEPVPRPARPLDGAQAVRV